MRVAISIITLSVLMGCAYPNPSNVPYGVTLSDGRAVVITLGMQTAAARVRSWLHTDLQSPEINFRFGPRSGHSEARA